MSGEIRILCVCTHNRTRSVMMGALLTHAGRSTATSLRVHTGGFQTAGEPPTHGTVDLLARRGLDVADHRSDVVTAEMASTVDLVLTAERDHVVTIAALGPGLFERTFTLPEFVERGRAVGPRDGAPLDVWLRAINRDRPRGLDYLSAEIAEIADPTGGSPGEWRRAADTISSLVDQVTALLG